MSAYLPPPPVQPKQYSLRFPITVGLLLLVAIGAIYRIGDMQEQITSARNDLDKVRVELDEALAEGMALRADADLLRKTRTEAIREQNRLKGVVRNCRTTISYLLDAGVATVEDRSGAANAALRAAAAPLRRCLRGARDV